MTTIRQAAEQQQQQRLLRVHAVLGLIEDDRLRAVEDRIGDFSVAARRQAVHEYCVRRGLLHQRFVHLERPEDRRALGCLVLEAHADADVGIDGVGSLRPQPADPAADAARSRLASARSRAMVTISMSGE